MRKAKVTLIVMACSTMVFSTAVEDIPELRLFTERVY